MKNYFCLLIALFIVQTSSFGQEEIVIKGNLIDKLNDSPKENAVIMAIRLKDSVMLGYVRSDMNGEFNLTLPMDTVEIIISHHQYDDKYIFFFPSANNKEINLVNTYLPEKSEMMNEVTIYAYKEPVHFRGDTLVYLADSFKTKQNAVVEDLLKKLPGIDVDKDGQITAQGREVNKILVDGDEFFGDDPTIATKNLGAQGVESVEIYEEENEDDSETADETIQVMDLRMKEGSKKGYFGTISGATDFTNFYEGELLANRFKDDFKISVFALGSNTPRSNFGMGDVYKYGLTNNSSYSSQFWNWGNNGSPSGIPRTFRSGFYYSDKISKKTKLGANYTYNNNQLNSVTDQSSQYFLQDTTYITNEKSAGIEFSESHSINLNLTHQLDSLTEIELIPRVRINNNSYNSFMQTDYVSRDDTLTSSNLLNNYNSSDEFTFSNEIKLNRKFAKEKRLFKLAYRFGMSENNQKDSLLSENIFYTAGFSNDTIDQLQTQKQINQYHRGDLLFREPLNDKWTADFEYYIKYSLDDQNKETFDNNNESYNLVNNELTNHFTTDKMINRIGGFIQYKHNKHRLKIGTYARNVLIDNINLNDNSTVNQNIYNILPQLNYNYKFSNSKRFHFSYKTNSAQPNMSQLQPVPDNSNPNRISIGNLNLQPTYAHRFNMRYSQWKALTGSYLWTNANYNITENAFSNSVVYDSIGRTISQTINVDNNQNGSFWLGAGIPLFNSVVSINPSISSSYNNNTNYVNGLKNITETLNATGELEIEIETDTIEFYIGANYTYSSPNSTLSFSSNQPFSTQEYFAEIGLELPFKFRIESEAMYTINSQRREGYNINFLIINAEISKRFLKTENLILSLIGNDILNQNVIAQRIVQDNVITDNRTTIISRYFLLKLTLKFNNTKTKVEDGFH